MQQYILIAFFSSLSIVVNSMDSFTELNTEKDPPFQIGGNLGMSCSYNDDAYNFSPTVSISFDFHIKNGYYFQLAPRYSWLYKWNEHYVTIPLHARKQFVKIISLYAGPCLSWDIGYFQSFGVSAGAYFHISKRSSILLSVYTFTLYAYSIDYRYIPLGISYNYFFL